MDSMPNDQPGTERSTSSVKRKRRVSPIAWILGFSAFLFLAFVLLGGKFLLTHSGLSEEGAGISVGGAKERIGVIELNGVILDSKRILKQLRQFEERSSVKAVVIRLNSPGGAVAPSQEIYQAVQKYSKPLVVSMSSVAASGAYYIAAGAKKVYANPGTITGSIGVIMQFTNLEKLYEWAKVSRYSIKTGKFKDAGAEYRSMTAEERELLQGMIDDTLVQFKAAVKQGRSLSQEELDRVSDGRIFSGSQAKALKLVDELGSLQDAIEDAAKQVKIEGKPQVVYPERPRKRLIEWLMEEEQEDSETESRAAGGVAALFAETLRGVLGVKASAPALEPGIYWLLPWGI
jgi:protease-4